MTEKKKKKQIDWVPIIAAFMEGDPKNPHHAPTMQSLAERFGVLRQTIQVKAKKEDWLGRRIAQRAIAADRIAQELAQKDFKLIAKSLKDISAHMDIAEVTLGKMLKDGTKERTMQTKDGSITVTEKLSAQDYKAVVATLRDIAKSKRELLDKASIEALEYDHRTALENYGKNIAQVLKEQIKDTVLLNSIYLAIASATSSTPKESETTAQA